jgi:hypothetical protein
LLFIIDSSALFVVVYFPLTSTLSLTLPFPHPPSSQVSLSCKPYLLSYLIIICSILILPPLSLPLSISVTLAYHPLSPSSLPPSYTGVPLLQTLSRAPNEKPSGRNSSEFFSDDHESGIFITGRLVLNAWKRMKSEMKLQSYTKHFVAQQLLNKKVKNCLFVFFLFFFLRYSFLSPFLVIYYFSSLFLLFFSLSIISPLSSTRSISPSHTPH